MLLLRTVPVQDGTRPVQEGREENSSYEGEDPILPQQIREGCDRKQGVLSWRSSECL